MPDSLAERLQAALGAAYVIERELDGGGMSRVFLAEETRFHRKVVIKLLSPELAAELSAERFEREIALAAGLQPEPRFIAVMKEVGGRTCPASTPWPVRPRRP
jgi:serine/threonine protein kinase